MSATSAACPYFPYLKIGNRKIYDGGFIFNNPSFITLKYLQS
jgi:hypothetical protein